MKGFIHIVEAVVVVILILLTLSQFFYFSNKSTYWEELSLERLSRDTLFTLAETEKSGIYFNETRTRNTIRSMLPGGSLSNIEFSVTVEGAILPKIRIACGNCTESDTEKLGRLLTNNTLEFNGRSVEFDIRRSINISEVNNFSDIDAMVFMNHMHLSTDETNAVIKFLSRGKGLVELSNLSGIDIDTNTQSIFSINDVTNPVSINTNAVIFKNSENKRGSNYKIWEYFSYIPAYVETIEPDTIGGCPSSRTGNLILNNKNYKTSTCTSKQVYIDITQDTTYNDDPEINEGPFTEHDSVSIDGREYNISKIDTNLFYYTINMPNDYSLAGYWDHDTKINATKPNTVVVALNGSYCEPSGSPCNRGDIALLVANDRNPLFDFAGRTVWIQNSTGTDWLHLFKTSVAWAAGTRSEVVKPFTSKPGALGSDYYINYYGDVFEPSRVILTMWYVF